MLVDSLKVVVADYEGREALPEGPETMIADESRREVLGGLETVSDVVELMRRAERYLGS